MLPINGGLPPEDMTAYKTMTASKTGMRHAYDGTMTEVLQPVDDNDLGVLAHFLAHLR